MCISFRPTISFFLLTNGLADLRSNIFSSNPESDELSLNFVDDVDDVDDVGDAADNEVVVALLVVSGCCPACVLYVDSVWYVAAATFTFDADEDGFARIYDLSTVFIIGFMS